MRLILLAIFIFAGQFSFAASASRAQLQEAITAINELFPNEIYEGGGPGTKCTLVHSSLMDVDPEKIEYSRTQLTEKNSATGVLESNIDVEFFYDGSRPLEIIKSENVIIIRDVEAGLRLMVLYSMKDPVAEVLIANGKSERHCFFKRK